MPPWRYSDKKPCGTEAAYRRHLYHGESPCRECRLAQAAARKKFPRKPKPKAAPAVVTATPQGPAWWCVIAAAEHLEWDGQPPGEVRREMADSAGCDPWAGGAA